MSGDCGCAGSSGRFTVSSYEKTLEATVDPVRARFSSWYEMFRARLRGDGRHATFRDVIERLPYVAGMGFDVLYLPPVHPIGLTARKGKNNAVVAKPDDVGSPWRSARRRAATRPSFGVGLAFPILMSWSKRERQEHRHSSGHRLPDLPRPSLRHPAPGVVPLAARRHYPVRRKTRRRSTRTSIRSSSRPRTGRSSTTS